MENLWPDIEFKENEKNNAVEILRHQARILEKMTNNKIKVTFSKMNYRKSSMSSISQLGTVITAIQGRGEEILEAELQDKDDVNTLFANTKYKFEIFNDEYRFRLFVLNNRPLFPINLEVDGGISEEIEYTNGTEINSNDELKNVIRDIFSCRKVKAVLSRMMSSNKE